MKPLYTFATLLLYISIGVATSIFANTPGEISGIVANGKDNSGIPGVHIYLDGTNFGTVTNNQGRFTLSDIPAGKYTLKARSIGFETFNLEISIDEKNVHLSIKLIESFQVLKGLTIESISITGGAQGVDKIPGSAHFISPKEMERFSSNDILQILRNVPGVNIQEEEGYGMRPNIGLRGTGTERSSKITVMEDGILIAPAPYVAPAAYYFPTTGRMQGIEVRKGSSQIKYGPYTTGGALNLISTSIPDNFMGRVYLFGGSYGKRTLHTFAGDASEKFGFVAETYQSAADGFKELDNKGNTGYKTEDYLLKFRVNSREDARVYQALTLNGGKYIEHSNETYLGLTDRDFEDNPLRRYSGSQKDQLNTRHGQLSLQHIIKPVDNFSVVTTFYHTNFSRNWYKLDKVRSSDSSAYIKIGNILSEPDKFPTEMDILKGADSPEESLSLKANNRTYYARGVQLLTNWQPVPGGIHNLEFGLRLHKDQIDRYQWVDYYQMVGGTMMLTRKGIPGTESNRIETANALAAYVQYEIDLNNWKLFPGLRYENIVMKRNDYGKQDPDRIGTDLKYRQNNIDIWIPGIGAEFNFNDYWNLFAGIHRGFSPPGTKEGTNPEISINYEVGARYSKSNSNFSFTLFYNDYQNLLGIDLEASGGTGSGDLFNGGEAKSLGTEVGYTRIIQPYANANVSFPVSFAYTYTDALFLNNFESNYDAWGTVQSGDKLPYIAPHQVVFNLGVQHAKYTLNFSTKYASPMRTQAGQGELVVSESTDPTFVIDLSGQYNFSWRLGFFASIRNITNNTYIVARRPAGVRPAMPRNFTLGLKANF